MGVTRQPAICDRTDMAYDTFCQWNCPYDIVNRVPVDKSRPTRIGRASDVFLYC